MTQALKPTLDALLELRSAIVKAADEFYSATGGQVPHVEIQACDLYWSDGQRRVITRIAVSCGGLEVSQ